MTFGFQKNRGSILGKVLKFCQVSSFSLIAGLQAVQTFLKHTLNIVTKYLIASECLVELNFNKKNFSVAKLRNFSAEFVGT